MDSDAAIVWFRQDLRISDNPALHAGRRHACVLPVFIWSPQEEGDWPLGAASRWWLHESLRALDQQLRKLGSRLVLRAGEALGSLRKLIADSGARAVYWNRRYEPAAVTRDGRLVRALTADGVAVESFNGSLLCEPEMVTNRSGKPFQVFTPFWKHCLSRAPGDVVPTPRRLPAPRRWPTSLQLDAFGLRPKIDWAQGLRAAWEPGCRGANRRWRSFLKKELERYHLDRDRLDVEGSSGLSPHLHFGEIGPRQLWRAMKKRSGSCREAWTKFLEELGWREFAYHLLFHFPETCWAPLRAQFKRFPWVGNRAALRRWQHGMTGFPIVDAAMRQLWHTGWMPNRARMIVASFLTKDLLISWQAGAEWFWDTLVDADLANNTFGWQWTAGCGADAAPFFRIFNPVGQAEKFDPQGDYIRRWVPEVSELPVPWIFKPWEAPSELLRTCGVRLGTTYPKPMVDHAEARSRALAAYRQL